MRDARTKILLLFLTLLTHSYFTTFNISPPLVVVVGLSNRRLCANFDKQQEMIRGDRKKRIWNAWEILISHTP